MRSRSSVSPLVVGALVVSALCTVMFEGGWMIWLPVVAALGVVGSFGKRSRS